VNSALDLAASRLATSLGTGWHLLPDEGDVAVATRVGEATIGRDILRSAVRRLYSCLVSPGSVEALCAESLAHAKGMVRESGPSVLTEAGFEGLASIWSYLSPGRASRDEMVEAGRTLGELLSPSFPESFLTNAAWEAHGCLMACLGGGLPRPYFFFVLAAEFSPLPMPVAAEEAAALMDACLGLPDYGRLIEHVLRKTETVSSP
jgi:hypothetical protein